MYDLLMTTLCELMLVKMILNVLLFKWKGLSVLSKSTHFLGVISISSIALVTLCVICIICVFTLLERLIVGLVF